jgi:hypothetical protein
MSDSENTAVEDEVQQGESKELPAEPHIPDLDDDDEDLDDDEDMDDEGDDGEDDVGWLVVYLDGRQQVLEHPEDVNKNEVLNHAHGAMKKGGGCIKIANHLLNMEAVWYFGWSENSIFPEVEQFDGLQHRIESLLNAVGMTAERAAFLVEQQAQLQAAQAQLFQEEVAEIQAVQAQALQEAASAPAPEPKAGKKPFKPPV